MTIAAMDLLEVFGPSYIEGVEDLRWFFAKNLGCRIVASRSILADNFPNPFRRNNSELFRVSICRSQPFRDVDKYRPDLFERTLAKGALFANLSKARLEADGMQLAKSAIWWENVGHFQVNSWFNIDMDDSLGDALDGTSRMYKIKHTDLGLTGMEKTMWHWLETH